jgi:hypothetical protein
VCPGQADFVSAAAGAPAMPSRQTDALRLARQRDPVPGVP